MRNNGVDVSVLEPSTGATQIKCMTFVKMWIADNFPEYAHKLIKRKVKRETMEDSRFVVGQMEKAQEQPIDLESRVVTH